MRFKRCDSIRRTTLESSCVLLRLNCAAHSPDVPLLDGNGGARLRFLDCSECAAIVFSFPDRDGVPMPLCVPLASRGPVDLPRACGQFPRGIGRVHSAEPEGHNMAAGDVSFLLSAAASVFFPWRLLNLGN